MEASKAQKARLGIFLLVAGGLLGGTILVLVGLSVFEDRDEYSIFFSGSVSGLEQGSQVRYNGLRIGRVETIRIRPDDVKQVEVKITIDGGTPVKKDTVAVLQMQGITGMKYIELTGGSNESAVLEPGANIESRGGALDDILGKAGEIAENIDKLVENLVGLTGENKDQIKALIENLANITGGENSAHLTSILSEVDANLKATRALLEHEDIQGILVNTRTASDEIVLIIRDVRATMTDLRASVNTVASGLNPRQLRAITTKAEKVLDQLNARLGPKELGAAIAQANTMMSRTTSMVTNVDVTLLRTRDDLRRLLDVLITGGENFADFAQILIDNPSALLSGRSEADRQLP